MKASLESRPIISVPYDCIKLYPNYSKQFTQTIIDLMRLVKFANLTCLSIYV